MTDLRPDLAAEVEILSANAAMREILTAWAQRVQQAERERDEARREAEALRDYNHRNFCLSAGIEEAGTWKHLFSWERAEGATGKASDHADTPFQVCPRCNTGFSRPVTGCAGCGYPGVPLNAPVTRAEFRNECARSRGQAVRIDELQEEFAAVRDLCLALAEWAIGHRVVRTSELNELAAKVKEASK